MNRTHQALLLATTFASITGCSDAPGTSLLSRRGTPALQCTVTRPLASPPEWHQRSFVQLASTASRGWCSYTPAEGTSGLAPIDATATLGSDVVLDVGVGHATVYQIAGDADRLGVLFRTGAPDPDTTLTRFVILDQEGRRLHEPTDVPYGGLVGLGDGSFGVVSLENASEDRSRADLVLRVRAADGTLASGPTPLARVGVAPPTRVSYAPLTLAPAPDGFVASWRGEDGWLARYDRTGAIAQGPFDLSGPTVLVQGDTTWVVEYARTSPVSESLWVAAIDREGAVAREELTTTSDVFASPRLVALHGLPVLLWSEGVLPAATFPCGERCVGTSIVRVAALSRDAEGHIVTASRVHGLPDPGGFVAEIEVAGFGDSLVLGMTEGGHNVRRRVTAAVDCTPIVEHR